MKKRTMALLAALCMALSLMPVQGFARENAAVSVEMPDEPITVTRYVVNPLYGGIEKRSEQTAQAPQLSSAGEDAAIAGLKEQLWATLSTGEKEVTVSYQADHACTGEELAQLAGRVTTHSVGSYTNGTYFCWRYKGYDEPASGEESYSLRFTFVTITDWGTLTGRLEEQMDADREVLTATVSADGEIPAVFLEGFAPGIARKLRLETDAGICLWEYDGSTETQMGEEYQYTLSFVGQLYYTELSAAAAELRAGLVRRESEISVRFLSDTDPGGIYQSQVDMALCHTGRPTEGDYLRWQYGGYNVSQSWWAGEQGYYCTNTFYFTYYTTAEQELQVDAFVENFLQSDAMRGALTDYQRVQVIYGWLCDNVTYDNARLNQGISHTAYAAAIDKTAVCQGYALLFYRLALECGIDARLIAGDGDGPHAWNAVKLGSKSYLADATWDAGKQPKNYQYFLKGSECFENHRPYVKEYVKIDETHDYYYDDTYDYVRLGVSPTAYNNVRDLNGDSAVTVVDLQALFDYLSTGTMTGCFADVDAFKEFADYNCDGTVNILDYQLLYALVRAGKTA